MLRDKNLIPLSHQHQHALALCVRIERASPIPEEDLAAWQAEVAQIFRGEIRIHFAAEEQVVFPAAREFEELTALIEGLLVEHAELRATFSRAEAERLSGEELVGFGKKLSNHIRKEERQLFEKLQQLLGAEELSAMGNQLSTALEGSIQACALPNSAAQLRKKSD